ncbi:MAG: SMP-30/gluconolactonase/LRE family protein [Planctomycetaceae bacterium]|nr:SMP-30/gluconolactonase/LRE family protein [Planctomycetaceae bacterium]
MQTIDCEVLHRPDSSALKFLPEGPYSLGPGRFSWVAIQHGADSRCGSINIFDSVEEKCGSWELPGRPGFAFPTDREGVFITGVERSLGLFDTNSGQWSPLLNDIDHEVNNTIVNDGVVFDGHLIFGCKDLEFSTKKAGLYLWRAGDSQLIRLRNDQICSNGKAVQRDSAGTLHLLDIDSPEKRITSSVLDPEQGSLGPQSVVVDLSAEEVFPDGMILTPDGRSLIVALYDPGDPDAGVARRYDLESGALLTVWRCPGSPRVTCPQLVQFDGKVRLVLTTAIEHMTLDQQTRHPNAGCLFVGETDFDSIGDQPSFSLHDGL